MNGPEGLAWSSVKIVTINSLAIEDLGAGESYVYRGSPNQCAREKAKHSGSAEAVAEHGRQTLAGEPLATRVTVDLPVLGDADFHAKQVRFLRLPARIHPSARDALQASVVGSLR